MRECRHLSDKMAMLRRHIHSTEDLCHVLESCFFGDGELFAAFAQLRPVEKASLLHLLSSDHRMPELEASLRRYRSS